ncbi:chlorite dismutase family protein [soil metagenome]
MFTVFSDTADGLWRVTRAAPYRGEALATPARIGVSQVSSLPSDAMWHLVGVPSYVRYVERSEKNALVSRQSGLGRPEATCAALIPIRKSATWWDMTQDERRAIFETQSHHITDSLKYLPAVARQLYHCRDLGQPFDFLTWFEYAPEHAAAFEELVDHLRASKEWTYVEREFDIRLSRA